MPYDHYRQCPLNHFPYVIRQGDTLYRISQAYHTSVAAIMNSNPGLDPERLRIGSGICIPLVCPAGYSTYIVRAGDTMSSIAGKYSVTVQALISVNPQITDPGRISIGQKLCIPAGDIINKQLMSMTLRQKIGQMVIAGAGGQSVDDDARALVYNYFIGGFILFGYNVRDSSQLLAFINTLKSLNSKGKAPLFMSVDEEGGRVSRMPEEFVNLPSSGAIGKKNNGELSYRIGKVIAEEIKAFGYNMDFAPVLDINSNPANPVIGDRAFGSSVGIVSRLGVQTLKGMQSEGIIPVVKHFPGHGDTSTDSHYGLPSVNNDLARLESFELIPFAEAIKNQADAVMIAHILLNRIDPVYPASLSKIIISDILRKQMNFTGVVITDDMTMGAIVKNYSITSAAIKAVNAGADIILVSRGYEDQIAVLNALSNAAANGTIPMARINQSVYRILRLKHKYNLTDSRKGPVDIAKINNDIRTVLKLYNEV